MSPTRPLRMPTVAHPRPHLRLGTLPVLALLLGLLAPMFARGADTPTASPGVHRDETSARVLLVVGAPGEPEFGSNFVHQADLWRGVAQSAGARLTTLGLDPTADVPETPGATNDLVRLETLLAHEPRDGDAELWLVLIGHGTFDGKEARFNLRGPDLTASNLATRLKPIRRPTIVINAASASGPFLSLLSATNRVTLTATRSGFEHNFSRFGRFFAEALTDPHGDLDQDGQTSVLEAFLAASHNVAEFYKTEGRMATEHALLDDNGDALGTPADWFTGLRATKRAKDGAALDGPRARQIHLLRSPDELRLAPAVRTRRDALERQIETLKESRATSGDDAYFARLEPILLELARLYRPAPTSPPPSSASAPTPPPPPPSTVPATPAATPTVSPPRP